MSKVEPHDYEVFYFDIQNSTIYRLN